MKKFIRFILFFALSAQFVFASPSAPVAGKDYTIIKNPPTITIAKNKVKVMEFFWYGCPHCREFEPLLENWLKKEGAAVDFERLPVTFGSQFIAHTQLYYTLHALGIERKMTPIIFNAIQSQNNLLLNATAQADFLSQYGIKKQDFLNTFNSFTVQSQVKQSQLLSANYNIDGVPTLIIQGKYKVDPSSVGGLSNVLQIASYLVKQIQDKKL